MRMVNRLLAFVLSLALIVCAIVLVIEVIAQRVGSSPVLLDWPAAYRWARETSWGAAPVRLISGLLVVIGLALLVTQLKPRRPVLLTLDSDNDATDAGVTRRGLARSVRNAVTDVDGVSDAKVAVHRRRIVVRAVTRAVQPALAASMRDAVGQAARSRIDAMRLKQTPTLSVRVSTKER